MQVNDVNHLVRECLGMEANYAALTGSTIKIDFARERLRDPHALKIMERWREIYEEVQKTSLVRIPRPHTE
jgi:hypothetical protein